MKILQKTAYGCFLTMQMKGIAVTILASAFFCYGNFNLENFIAQNLEYDIIAMLKFIPQKFCREEVLPYENVNTREKGCAKNFRKKGCAKNRADILIFGSKNFPINILPIEFLGSFQINLSDAIK